MKHRSYKFIMEQNANMLRKNGYIEASKKNRNLDYLSQGVRFLVQHNREFLETLENVICAEEWYWLNSDKDVYFFDDAETARNVSNGSYRIEDITPMFSGNESFVLMLPKEFAINGSTQGGGFLVTVFDHTQRNQDIFAPYYNHALDIPSPNIQRVGDHGNWTVSVSYQEDGHSGYRMRCAMPNHQINGLLKCKSVADYRDYMRDNNHFNYLGGADLEGAEFAYQFEVMRLVAGFLVYRHALPERIKSGFPTGSHKDAHTQVIKRVQATTVSAPAGVEKSTSTHYRSWHFRQLIDDRFYKGEHEQKARGSRVVFVKDSMVNREVKASTVH